MFLLPIGVSLVVRYTVNMCSCGESITVMLGAGIFPVLAEGSAIAYTGHVHKVICWFYDLKTCNHPPWPWLAIVIR